eukprot:5379435-Lingulodinium_polyedra.AAC.1
MRKRALRNECLRRRPACGDEAESAGMARPVLGGPQYWPTPPCPLGVGPEFTSRRAACAPSKCPNCPRARATKT